MLVAYSTVAQIGYLFLVFPLATGFGPEVLQSAWQGGVLQALAHALAKAAMFAAAGAMIVAAGSDEMSRLAGVGARLPLTPFTFGLAGATLIGLPPSGGFAAKWLLLSAALAGGQWWWGAVMLIGGLLTAAYVFRVLREAFQLVPAPLATHAVSPALEWTGFVLALGGILLGLFAGWPLMLLGTAGAR